MDYEEILEQQFEKIVPSDELEELIKSSNLITNNLTSEFTIDNILNQTIKGESIFNNEYVIDSIKSLVLFEFKCALIICVEILTICIVIGLLKELASPFSKSKVSEIAILICNTIIIGLVLKNFSETYSLAAEIVDILTKTMEILAPILLGILISTGNIASGTILNPFLIGSIAFISYLMKKVVLPMMFFCTILTTINSLTEKNYVNKMGKLLKNASLAITGLIVLILSGIIKIQGILSEASDGILINTAKYSISNFIPIVGGFTSETIELYIKCMGTIKGIVGVFGIILLLLLILIPIIKILAISIIYKITAAVTEPITTTKLSDTLNEIGSILISLAAIVFFNSLLYIIFISTIISIGE